MNMKATLKGFSTGDLEAQKNDVESRLKFLENHLKEPQSPKLSDQVIFNRLMETEQAMLAQIRKLLVNR